MPIDVTQPEAECHRGERGDAMAALLVTIAVMAVALTALLPAWSTLARRERETELIFRGEQYARAIALFGRKYGNAAPPSVDVLLNEKFLRKKYKDPITGEDFQLLTPTSPQLAQALTSPPVQPGRGSPTPTSPSPTGRGAAPARTTTQQGRPGGISQPTGGGGIVGVASTSTQQSLRVYNGKDKYNEWVFLGVQQSQRAGGVGAPVPGGRGTTQPGGRGQPTPGRGGPPPAPGRGRGL